MIPDVAAHRGNSTPRSVASPAKKCDKRGISLHPPRGVVVIGSIISVKTYIKKDSRLGVGDISCSNCDAPNHSDNYGRNKSKPT